MTADSNPNPELVRRRVFFSGRVQGVGFRYTTEAVASRFKVAGFVRNVPDGRVELVAEGLPVELDRFLQGVEQAMSGHIDDRVVSQTHATSEFTGFSISF